MRYWIFIVAIGLAAVARQPASAQDGGCSAVCPRCDHICQLSRETLADKKHCWKVECKPICIPRVTFPWEKCCEPKCAKIKYVNVLVRHEYECRRCAYKWTAVTPDCTCTAPPEKPDPLGALPVPQLPPVLSV